MAALAPPAPLLQLVRAGLVRPLGALTPSVTRLPTGLTAFDSLLEGGLPRGAITALAGGPSSGVRALTMQAVAGAQRSGLLVAWVDAAGALDSLAAWRAGVRLDDLLLAQPDSMGAALSLAHDLVNEGSSGLILLDVGGAALPESAARLLSHAAARSSAALVCLAAPAVPVACADLRLSVTRSGWEMVGGDICGLRARVTIEGGHGWIAGRFVDVLLRVDEMAPCWPAS